MKALLALAGFIALDASASYTVRPIAYTPPQAKHSWFCTADGYDYNGIRHSVNGGLKPTPSEAARDAIRSCQNIFTTCQTSTCLKE